MAGVPLPLPDDIRQQVRDRKFANTRDETEAIFVVDQMVNRKVHVHESYLAKVAEELNAEAGADIDTASALLHQSAELMQAVTRGDVLIDQAAAKSYQSARAQMVQTIEQLRYLKQRIDFTADKAADPYKSLTEILSKYSALRGGRSWHRD